MHLSALLVAFAVLATAPHAGPPRHIGPDGLVPPRPAPAPPPPPRIGPLPPPPPPNEDALWREIDRLVALEESSGTGPTFNLTDFNGAPVSAEGAKRCEHSLREALHQQRLGAGPRIYADKLSAVSVAHREHPDDPRLVYFVMLSRPSSHLTVSRLIHAVYHPANLFLLHLDVKLNESSSEAVQKYVKNLQNVHVMRMRRLVQWGAFTMVSVLLDAMRTVVEVCATVFPLGTSVLWLGAASRDSLCPLESVTLPSLAYSSDPAFDAFVRFAPPALA